jgi:hypothetical protein
VQRTVAYPQVVHHIEHWRSCSIARMPGMSSALVKRSSEKLLILTLNVAWCNSYPRSTMGKEGAASTSSKRQTDRKKAFGRSMLAVSEQLLVARRLNGLF